MKDLNFPVSFLKTQYRRIRTDAEGNDVVPVCPDVRLRSPEYLSCAKTRYGGLMTGNERRCRTRSDAARHGGESGGDDGTSAGATAPLDLPVDAVIG